MAGPGDRVVAAVSGGADSVCMLLLLDRIRSEIGFSMRALHVHHGIRGESADEDARFVSQLCERLGVRCDVIRVDVPAIAKAGGTGIEETAREERYRVLREACQAWEREDAGARAGRYCIAVAHHMEDQAETVLFRMARGSGLTGVAGMRPAAPLPGDPEILVIRPLLQFTRAEIEEIVTEAGTGWREDETNSDVSYARNRIRSGILPELAQINEAAVRHICALAEESAPPDTAATTRSPGPANP
ncbi:MAG: tRNA lysidine(34) synthetase TilS, partial [Lachnospiraceae bacterium]|nr:tRNA lysidine(34) synthetase TilS [Lachnospiraceae bacterium]